MAKKQDKIGEDKPDGTEIQGTQEVKPETTPEPEEVVTLSSKEHQELMRQAKAASDLGRTLKTTLESQTTLQSGYNGLLKKHSQLEENFKTFKGRDREREYEQYKDDKGMLDALKLKHHNEDERENLIRERSEYEAERTQYQARLDAAAKREAEDLAKELANDSGLAATLLIQIGTDTSQEGKTTYNLERMKAIAKSVPKEKEEEEEGEEGEKEPAVKGQRSRAAGTGSQVAQRGYRTFADYELAFGKGEISYEQYTEAAKRFNVQI